MYDNSGQWTGHMDTYKAVTSLELPGRITWGSFDSHYQQDVWESLKKVDMKIDSYRVGNKGNGTDYLSDALPLIDDILKSNNPVMPQTKLYQLAGLASDKRAKDKLGSILYKCGAEAVRPKRMWEFDFSKFDKDAYMKAIQE